jgi:hypothetical protein
MNSDLSSEFGPLDPGVDQLFRTLTAGPVTGELAGQQAALTMFQLNAQTAASGAAGAPNGQAARSAAGMTAAAGAAGAIPIPAAAATGRRFGWPWVRPVKSTSRPPRARAGWGVRLVAAAALSVAGGLTAAAYAAVLPQPMQHLAYQVFGWAGMPDAHHAHPSLSPSRFHHSVPVTSQPATSPGQVTPASSSRPHHSTSPSAGPSRSASPSPSPSPSAVPLLSVSAASSQIPAGSVAVIDGQLTGSGKAMAGAKVMLLERIARHVRWHVAGTATTNAQGDVDITTPVLAANAAFELTGPGGSTSKVVLITVVPQVEATLRLGAAGLRDLLVVTTMYAHRGNVVVLQVQTASGAWVSLRERLLNAAGRTRFVIKARKLQNKQLRVVLLATVRHAAAVSNTVTVPPPP